jgi:hypothetical protein
MEIYPTKIKEELYTPTQEEMRLSTSSSSFVTLFPSFLGNFT